jgi:uncharacterized protein (TIGR02996 family)
MPRYELVKGTSNKFWEIELGAKSSTTTWGRIGASGQNMKTRSYASDAEMKKDYDRLVREKTTEGYKLVGKKAAKADRNAPPPAVEPRNPKLEKLICDDPDDDGNFTVYGDWLAAQGSPRGELAAMNAKNMKKPAEKLLAKHPELWGDLVGHQDMLEHVTWRGGFIDKAKIMYARDRPDGKKSDVPAVLAMLLDGPGRFIRELTVGLVDDQGNSYDPITALLAKRGPLPTLRSLYYGSFTYEETELNWSSIGNLAKLYAAVPKLQRLKLRSGDAMKLGTIVLPELREFSTVTGGMQAASAKAIATATWPKLETLDLMLGDHGLPGPTVKDIQPILDAKGLGKLTWLGITNFNFHKELVPALLASKILKQLKTLDLSMGTLGDQQAAILGAAKNKLGHLEQLIVGENYFTAVGLKALKQLGVKIVSTGCGLGSHGNDVGKLGQRALENDQSDDPDHEDYDGDRYAAVYE